MEKKKQTAITNANLNHNLIGDNKVFWEAAKPFYPIKQKSNKKIALLEDGKTTKIITKNAEHCTSHSNYQN